MFWTIFSIVELAWVAFLICWIVLENRSPTGTLAWIFGLAFLPMVGVVIYFFAGPRRLRRKHFRRSAARGAVSAWTGGREVRGRKLPEPDSECGRAVSVVAVRAGEAPALQTDGVHLFFDGDGFFEALLEAIRSARHHIHIELYILAPGQWADRLSEALRARAREGVQIRLLLDAYGSGGMHRRAVSPLIGAGVEVAFFNSLRFSRFKPRLSNFRTHRKIAIMDGQVAFLGGMNIADEHSRTIAHAAAWRDCHARFTGDAVPPLALVFLEDWHYATGSSPQGAAFAPPPRFKGDGPLVQIAASGPDLESRSIALAYFAALGGARRRAWATTAYFVPDEATLAAFTGAALRGVDVRLLVPRKCDARFLGAAQRTYYADLLRAGARIFEYLPGMMHSKTLAVDDDLAIVGSANLDNRSFRLNFEAVALIYGADAAQGLAAQFERNITLSEEVTLRHIGETPLRRRLLQGVSRLFSPIM